MKLKLEVGGELTVIEGDGDRAVVLSPTPFPPGASAVAYSMVAADEAAPEATSKGPTWILKVRGCRSEGTGFRVEGRWVNLTRAQKEQARAAGTRQG